MANEKKTDKKIIKQILQLAQNKLVIKNEKRKKPSKRHKGGLPKQKKFARGRLRPPGPAPEVDSVKVELQKLVLGIKFLHAHGDDDPWPCARCSSSERGKGCGPAAA